MTCGGMVLCGGQSTRMGLPKEALPFGPELMLTRVIRILREVVDPVIVVAAPRQALPQLEKDMVVVRDRREARGPLEGVAAGLATMAKYADAAYVTGCDVPLLQPSFVRRMTGLLDDFDIAVPKEGRFHHPLAAVYRTGVLKHIQRLLNADRLRPVYLFSEVRTREVSVDDLRQVDPRLLSLQNLNRPRDYLAALRQAGFEAPDAVLAQLRRDPGDGESS